MTTTPTLRTMTREQVLSHYGWTIECERPFEIRNINGSFATLSAATIVRDALVHDAIFDGVTEAVQD